MSAAVPSDSKSAFVVLCAAGWSVEAMSVRDASGAWRWVVTGCHGGQTLRAVGPTEAEAWNAAVEQARALGLLEES